MSLIRWVMPSIVAAGALFVGVSAIAQPAPTWAQVGQVFADNCTRCHSGVGRAGLKLDTYANAIAGGNSGPALVAGNPNDSLLMKRIRGEIPPQMPRGAAPLSAEQIQLIADWITAGMPQ